MNRSLKMGMPELEIYDHSGRSDLSLELVERYEARLAACLSDLIHLPQGPERNSSHGLHRLLSVEISIVDDECIADVHARFLDDPSPTDVITFPHGDGMGEILVSIDTAKRQGAELGEPWDRELFRYMVHGMLHLHGYLDYEPEERESMFALQEPLVLKYWIQA